MHIILLNSLNLSLMIFIEQSSSNLVWLHSDLIEATMIVRDWISIDNSMHFNTQGIAANHHTIILSNTETM